MPTGESVDVTFEIVPDSATPGFGFDYEYLSPTATFDAQTGVYTDTVTIASEASNATIAIDILQDTLEESAEAFTVNITGVSSNAEIGTSSAAVTIQDDDTVVTTSVLYRVNAGGSEVAATDGGIAWSADTFSTNSSFLANAGSNSTVSFNTPPGATVAPMTPASIFESGRWDKAGGSEMQWAFDTPEAGLYEVRLFMGEGFFSNGNQRVFDVAIEGEVLSNLNDIDLVTEFGTQVGGMISNTVAVTDGMLNIDFLHDVVENPLVSGIEIIQLGDSVSLADGPYTIGENDGQVQIPLLSDVTVPNGETIDVTFEIVPSSATPGTGFDYEYLSPTNTFDAQTGVYTDTISISGGSSETDIIVDILQDTQVEGSEAFTVNITDVSQDVQIGTDSVAVIIQDDEDAGSAVLTVTVDSDNVQTSNFGNNSFQITNTGDKKISQVNIDVTNALYPDTVFDPFGLAGDTASKALQINTNGGTGVNAPSIESYIGDGGTAGFEGLQLTFDENVNGGFESGETLGFSIDMDPNSVAGADQTLLNAGSNPFWDVGGVSGAELIGSTFTVTFTDGDTATGQLQGVGNQAGSQALASQTSPESTVSLTVNSVSAGGVGTYDDSGPTVVINGTTGQTARVVLSKGFMQPVTNEFFNSPDPADQTYAPVLQSQLNELTGANFPANNAVEFQTFDVLLTGGNQDISDAFDYSGVANFDFEGESQIPLGFVASVIDHHDQ